MPRSLLEYLQDEIHWLTEEARRFARAHPGQFGGLDEVAVVRDPHIERLLHGTAFLAARVRERLDRDLPELSEALIEVLFPGFLAPIPSMSVVQFNPKKAASMPPEGLRVASRSAIEVRSRDDALKLRYRTAGDMIAWPVRVERAALVPIGPGLAQGSWKPPRGTESVLEIDLQIDGPDRKWSSMQLASLRFFLCGGGNDGKRLMAAHALRELLLRSDSLLGVFVSGVENAGQGGAAGKETSRIEIALESEPFVAVGFEDSEALLDPTPAMLAGSRLLLEYFAMQERFLFVELRGLRPAIARIDHSRLRLRACFARRRPEIESYVDAETFALHCAPVINLFGGTTEQVELDQRGFEHELICSGWPRDHVEIRSVDSVLALPKGSSRGEDEVAIEPLLRTATPIDAKGLPHAKRFRWAASRRATAAPGDPGTSVFLSVVDPDLDPFEGPKWSTTASVTCMNRELPRRLFDTGPMASWNVSGGSSELRPRIVVAPTPTRRLGSRSPSHVRLLSMLALHHRTLGDVDSLRALLELHDRVADESTRQRRESVLAVESTPATGTVSGGRWIGICRGAQVHLTIDESKVPDGGWYTLASILDRVVASYCSINSFTQLTAVTAERPKEVVRWPKRAGQIIVV